MRFARGGPTLTFFYEGREDPDSTKSGPSSARQPNAIYMAFRWWADDGPSLSSGFAALRLFRGSGPVLLRNPIFLWFFRGRGPDPLLLLFKAVQCELRQIHLIISKG